MSRKSILVALVAAATFGLTMISVDRADAAVGAHNTGRTNVGRVNIARVNLHVPNRPGPHLHPRIPLRPHWHVYLRRPHLWVAGAPLVYGAVAPVVGTNRCTCLTKEYTPEGAVVFKDICTNEMAMNPPAVAPTAQVQPQEPQK